MPPRKPKNNEEKPPLGVRFFRQLHIGVDWSPGQKQIEMNCPFCNKEGHFFVNAESGCWDCKVCGEEGNTYTFARRLYEQLASETTPKHYAELRRLRDIPPQTAKWWGLVYSDVTDNWWIPYRNREGVITSVDLWNPEIRGKKPYCLTGLSGHCLLGLDALSDDRTKPVYICEGPTDTFTVHHALTSEKHRGRYDVLGVPGANSWRDDWCDIFQARTVFILYDNDEAGRKGQQNIIRTFRDRGIPATLFTLTWPNDCASGYDMSDLWQEYDISLPQHVKEWSEKATIKRKSKFQFKKATMIESRKLEWLWNKHIELGSLVSLSGDQGTCKSSIARDFIARVSAGLPFPGEDIGDPAARCIYFTSEDAEFIVRDNIEAAGGNLDLVDIHGLEDTDGDILSIATNLPELEEYIKHEGVRLIVLDGFNSFVGSDDLGTDARARALAGPIHRMAQATGCCVIGIRHWSKSGHGNDARSRELGPSCFSDLARTTMFTTMFKDKRGLERRTLGFQKVSNAPLPASLSLEIKPAGNEAAGTEHIRVLQYLVMTPKEEEEHNARLREAIERKVPQKGTKNDATALPPETEKGTTERYQK